MTTISRRAFSLMAASGLLRPALGSNTALAGTAEELSLQGYKLAFESNFDQLKRAGPDAQWDASGQWTPRYRFDQDPRGCSFHGEYQWYVDPRHDFGDGVGRVHPFSVSDGELTITAQRTPEALLHKLPNRLGLNKENTGIPYPWISGVITTQHSFWFKYGYAEALVKLPAGRTLWPAFWMLPKEWPYPPEVDIMEFLGNEPRKSNYNVIAGTEDKPMDGNGEYADRGLDLTLDWHTFGCLWTPQAFEFFMDRKSIGKVAAHPTMDRCHYYLVLNLAVGGKWPGIPGPDTPSPAELKCRYIRVWQAA
jgi:beta-glucanase (GH16 family)